MTLARLHRRARRLLPAGLATIGLLAPVDPACWEASPLSRLSFGHGTRGLLGLRLEGRIAAAIRESGLRWLQGCTRADAAVARLRPWRVLPGADAGFWTCREDGCAGWLLDARADALWLLWQEPGTGRMGCCG